MVQMKGDYLGLLDLRCRLYIPHGSDERLLSLNSETTGKFFISHMVQMKGMAGSLRKDQSFNFISHMVQMKAATINPCPLHFQLYIPHGSDERTT